MVALVIMSNQRTTFYLFFWKVSQLSCSDLQFWFRV